MLDANNDHFLHQKLFPSSYLYDIPVNAIDLDVVLSWKDIGSNQKKILLLSNQLNTFLVSLKN